MNLIDRKRHLFGAERGPNGYNFLQILLLTVTGDAKKNVSEKKATRKGRRSLSCKKTTI